MSNLRIIYNNAMDRVGTLIASSTAGSLAASNLLTDLKSEVWRSTSTTATLTAQWALSEPVGGLILPFTNLTSTATVRVRGYTDPGDASPAVDTGVVLASPAGLFGSPGDWGTTPLGTNSFIPGGVGTWAYGGGSAAYVWFATTNVKKVVIDIVDSANTAGYIEAGRLVLGSYWEAQRNPDYGSVSLSVDETTKGERADSGDYRVDRGTQSKALTINFQYMTVDDRDHIYRIMRRNGMSKPMLVSLTPGSSDIGEEQIFMVYGFLAKSSALQYQYFNQFAANVTIEEI